MPAHRKLFALYIADVQSRCSKQHATAIARQIRHIEREVVPLNPATFNEFRQRRVKLQGVAHRTVNAEHKALSACFEWGIRMGHVKENPYRLIRRLPETARDLKKRRRALTDVEIKKLLTASMERDREWNRSHDMTLIWRTLIETGMRWGEAITVTADDIVDDTIVLPGERTKTGEPRMIPLRPALAKKLQSIAVDPAAPLFSTPLGHSWENNAKTALQIFYNTLKRAGIAKKDPLGRSVDIHALRWTCITKMQRCGVSEPFIALVAGHARPRGHGGKMTRAYTDLGNDDLRKELREKVWRLPPGKKGSENSDGAGD